MLAAVCDRDTLIVLRGAWQKPPPGRRAGNPAGATRRSAVPHFVHCVSLAYTDTQEIGTEAEVVAVVVEGTGTLTIQGVYIDGETYNHTVAEL